MSIDHYPSTHDFWLSGEESVLGCIIAARTRVAEDHSIAHYIGAAGEVCAVGGVFAAIGLDRSTLPHGLGKCLWSGLERQVPWEGRGRIEARLIAVAKEAIALLDEVAEERHPEARRLSWTHPWMGVLEWVNQEWIPPGCTGFLTREGSGRGADKAEILAIYDATIERRKAQLLQMLPVAVPEPAETLPVERELVPA